MDYGEGGVKDEMSILTGRAPCVVVQENAALQAEVSSSARWDARIGIAANSGNATELDLQAFKADRHRL